MRRLLQFVSLLLVLVDRSSLRAQSYVQAAFKDTSVSGTVTAAFPNVTTAGNTYIVFVAVDSRHGGVLGKGPVDTEGNAFRQVLVTASPNRTTKQYVYDCIGIVGGSRDAIHLSATTGINVGIIELHDAKYLDQKAQQGGIANSATSPSVTTTQAKEILIGLMSGNPAAPFPGFNAAGAGWTRTAIAGGTQSAQYRVVTSVQTDIAAPVALNPGALSPNTDWVAGIFSYSAAAP